MGLWVIGEGWGPFLMRHWTHFPDRAGNDDVNLPPPAVAATARRGPPQHDQGHIYRTWDIQGFTADPKDRQLILDKREALDVTHGDPNAIVPGSGPAQPGPQIPGPAGADRLTKIESDITEIKTKLGI